MELKGGCLCGAVKVEAKGDPVFTGNCYCADCQKGSGCGHITVVAYPDAAVAITGPIKTFVSKGDSGADVTRAFCSNCGAGIYGAPSVMAGMTLIRAGILDQRDKITPVMSIFAASAASWDKPSADIPSFPGAPPPPQS